LGNLFSFVADIFLGECEEALPIVLQLVRNSIFYEELLKMLAYVSFNRP
jgi:hypothetical protein